MLILHVKAGEYIISVRAYASSNYDGEEQLLHARFYDENGTELGYSIGGFPEERDVWETVSVTIDLGDNAPSSVDLYFGYPVQSNHGKLLIRQVTKHIGGSKAGSHYFCITHFGNQE